MRMSRNGVPRGRVLSALFGAVLVGCFGLVAGAGAEAQTSIFDPRFEEIRRASVAWDSRNGPEREVVDLVCLVPDLPTYFEAIAAWDEHHYFPILIDDVQYTLPFLRAFRPARVVRFPGNAEKVSPEMLWDKAVAAVGRSWTSANEVPRGDAAPKSLGATPPGVVLSEPDGPALAGAVGLASGRFQPLIRWTTPKKFGDKLTLDEARATARSLETLLAERRIPYDQLGDDCDFVTLAGDYPYRYEAIGRRQLNESRGQATAFDDLILRSVVTGKRWGYAGRLLGDATSSVYRAMCSLFLRPRSALLFNTYGEQSLPWSAYAMPSAAARLGSLIAVTHRSGDKGTLAAWHQVFEPVNRFGLLLINTSGGPASFNIPGGPGNTADVPEGGPTAVLIIHSYSAESPDDPETLAGRWLANGAFVYYGAMNEPFLDAFRPPGLVATFLGENLPVVTAVRRSGIEPFGDSWRLVYLGDPLYRLKSLGPPNRLTEWKGVEDWPAYGEFRQPPAEAPEDVRLVWAVKTAIFRLQTRNPPRQRSDLADFLLAIARDRVEPKLRPVHDDLLADALLQANRGAELRERLGKIPPADRSPNVKRHLETSQTSALQRAVDDKDFGPALSLWLDVIRVRGSREFAKTFTDRVGKLAESAGRLDQWRSRLRGALEQGGESGNSGVVQAELTRVEKLGPTK